MKSNTRNSYIDLIKFIFAIVIVLFHMSGGVFPGGRVAVEGFFMISGYLMMRTIDRENRESREISAWHFIKHKYCALFPYLLPSILIGYTVISIRNGRTLTEHAGSAQLLFTDIIPLKSLGFYSWDAVGISWYLSAMFFALFLLYPICRKYGEKFILNFGIPAILLSYGELYHVFGAINVTTFTKGSNMPWGLVRGLAGCLSGCVIWILIRALSTKRINSFGKTVLLLIELCAHFLFFYNIQVHPKSEYDYAAIAAIFVFLTIGISGVTGLWNYYSHPFSKVLGTASTLFVLNHVYWKNLLSDRFGSGYARTPKGLILFALVIITSAAVWGISLAEKRLAAVIRRKLGEN